MKLPENNVIYQFENASVIYSNDHSEATNQKMPKLYVQCIDHYNYQKELTVQYRHEAGNSQKLFWHFSAYQHPGRRTQDAISEKVASKFILRFLDVCEKHPNFLFNKRSVERGGSTGFVHLMERIHSSYNISVRMLP